MELTAVGQLYEEQEQPAVEETPGGDGRGTGGGGGGAASWQATCTRPAEGSAGAPSASPPAAVVPPKPARPGGDSGSHIDAGRSGGSTGAAGRGGAGGRHGSGRAPDPCFGPRHNKYAKNRRLFLAACHAHLMYDATLRGERLAATAVCVCGDGGGTGYIPPPPSIMDATARGPRCRGAAHRARAVSGPWSKETSSR